MAAWSDDAYDRDEAYGQHVTSEAFYPECTLADLVAAIDECERVMAKGADETAELRRLVA